MKYQKKYIPLLLFFVFLFIAYWFCLTYMVPFGEEIPFGDLDDLKLSFIKFSCLFFLQSGMVVSISKLLPKNKQPVLWSSIIATIVILLIRQFIWFLQTDHDTFYLSLFQSYSIYVALLHLGFGLLFYWIFSAYHAKQTQNTDKIPVKKIFYIFGSVYCLYFSYILFTIQIASRNVLQTFVCAFCLQAIVTYCLLKLWPAKNQKALMATGLVSAVCFIVLRLAVWLENLDIAAFLVSQFINTAIILAVEHLLFSSLFVIIFLLITKKKSFVTQ